MTQNSEVYRSFLARDNDLECRSWIHRSFRYARSRLYRLCNAGGLLALEPTVVKAWQKGWDVPHYIRLLRWRERGFKPSIIYDIGAYEGAWSEMCSALFGPRRIVLFEPQTELHQKIRVRQRQVRSGEWKIMPFALGERDASEVIHLTRNNAAASLLPPVRDSVLTESATGVIGTNEISVRSLDSVAAADQLEPADLIKIDVQGFENQVLDGGRTCISQAAKLVIEVSLREIYSGQALLMEVLQKVAACGFVVEDITETLRQWPGGELWQVDLWLSRNPRP